MSEKRRDIFISDKPEPGADDSAFWEWLDEEDEAQYQKMKEEGKILIDIDDEESNG